MKFLLFISQNYSFEILRPLQHYAWSNGDEILWIVYNNNLDTSKFNDNEHFTTDITAAINFNPDAVFAPGNIVPSFIPGLKVQIFHGFEWKKKGHFRIRECFDLYCTQGPFFTDKFESLAKNHNFFDVVETGWPKLDPLFSAPKLPLDNNKKPVVLYAPTFSPALTSVPDLFNEIIKLSRQGDYHWIVKFHPKMATEWVEKFSQQQQDIILSYKDMIEDGLINRITCLNLIDSDHGFRPSLKVFNQIMKGSY